MATIRQKYKMAIAGGILSNEVYARAMKATAEEVWEKISVCFSGMVAEFTDALIKEDQEHEEKTYKYLEPDEILMENDEVRLEDFSWEEIAHRAIGIKKPQNKVVRRKIK